MRTNFTVNYLILIVSILLIMSCSKDGDKVVNVENKVEFANVDWNRISMETNPLVLLPKNDGSGTFYEVSDLMDLKDLNGYDKNMEGYYTFNDDKTYSFTDAISNEIKKGTYEYKNKIITAVNSKGDILEYKVISNTDETLILELAIIFFGQETTIKISCSTKQTFRNNEMPIMYKNNSRIVVNFNSVVRIEFSCNLKFQVPQSVTIFILTVSAMKKGTN